MKRFIITLGAVLFALLVLAQENVQMTDSLDMELDSIMKHWEITLDEVVVKSTLPKTQIKGDALRTTVAGSVLEKSGSTTDLLAKLPMLKAGKGEGVEVIGRGAAEVYINGRKVMDMNELDRLRSDQIQSVDIVQNPGARYSASTKAVVRIQLKKQQGEGISVLDNLDAYYQYNGTIHNNIDVNYRTGGLDLTASLWTGTFGGKSLQENTLRYMLGPDVYAGVSTQEQFTRYNGYSPQLQFNYMINENHSLGAFYKWDVATRNRSHGFLNTDSYLNGEKVERSESNLDINRDKHIHIVNGYYSGKVKNLSIDFNMDLLFNRNTDNSNTTEATTDYVSGEIANHIVDNHTRSTNNLCAFKLVLAHPVWEGNLSFGGEYSRNRRTDIYTYESSEVLPVKASDNVITENMASAFVDYGRRFGRVFLQAGLRYEHLDNIYMDFGVKDESMSRGYGDIFPTAVISMPVGKTQLSLTYRKDINRPSYDNLTNSTIYINRYTYQRGNPYLKPNYIHNLVLNMAYQWLNVSATYGRDIDFITMLTEPFPGSEDPYVSLLHPANSDQAFNKFTLSAYARPVISFWHPVFSAYVSFQDYKQMDMTGKTVTMNRPLVQLSWSNDFVLPRNYRLYLNMFGSTCGDYSNFRITRGKFTTVLGAQREFSLGQAGRLNVDMRVIDPFCTNVNKGTIMGVRELDCYNPAKTTFELNVTWKFNEAQKKYKGTGAGENMKQRM
ncbi:outer membrane beta-barrel protein [Sodaliphilus sp.]|uniref:outer membrane beta-barrel protein n=1 Tax=Sodaliphilus sp. TaxID=2815818 RepID=UPI00388E205B